MFPFLLLFSLLVPFIVASFLASWNSSSFKPDFLQALLHVLTPSTSVWPPTYSRLHLSPVLPLENVLEDVVKGRIELRKNGHSLLLRLALQNRPLTLANDFSVSVGAGFDAWRKTFSWWIKTEWMSLCSPQTKRRVHFQDHTTDKAEHFVFLDSIPRGALERTIRDMQRKTLHGDSLVLEFSTCSRRPTTLFTKQNVILSLILSNSRPTMPLDGAPVKLDGTRTATPLLVTLPDILALLTSGPRPLVVFSVKNVSHRYGAALGQYARGLEEDRKRVQMIEQFGAEEWRRERLLKMWEAELYNGGWMSRWIVRAARIQG